MRNDGKISLAEVSRQTGISKSVLADCVTLENFQAVDNKIGQAVFIKLKEEREKYISLKEFLQRHSYPVFDPNKSHDRSAYIEFLEKNDYFGVQRVESENVMFGRPRIDEFYLLREDMEFLDFRSKEYWEEFGLSELERTERFIAGVEEKQKTKGYLQQFHDELTRYGERVTPSYTQFVKTILSSIKEITEMTREDIMTLCDNDETIRTNEYICMFANYVRKYERVSYPLLPTNFKSKSKPVEAYQMEMVVDLAELLFNDQYDRNNRLTERALENHNYAEMWLFLSLHYVCGWRSSDICDGWVYLNLESDENDWGINRASLKEDIIADRIDHKLYEDVTEYILRRIDIAQRYASKTRTGSVLIMRITPELKEHFGKLVLIAEYHQYASREGYMRKHRAWNYLNWTELKSFFGDAALRITGQKNLQSRRLNKSFLQGVEDAAREGGVPALAAHMIASYARNHADANTTLIYLQDHNFTGETAEVVIFFMLQRGVMSSYLYTTLIEAYPDTFQRLSVKEQTEIMKMIPVSGYELEVSGSFFDAGTQLQDMFQRGDKEGAQRILKAMFAIGQGRGVGKDKGVFCIKRALGEKCVNPDYESCIANVCPYHVLTREGIPALIRVLKYYKDNQEGFQSKNRAVLNKVIIPAFHDVIRAIMKEMTSRERKGIIKLIEEAINEE